jgi:hypothetical protein
MNTLESIFKEGINISELTEIFKALMGDAADVLAYPSCVVYSSLVNQDSIKK